MEMADAEKRPTSSVNLINPNDPSTSYSVSAADSSLLTKEQKQRKCMQKCGLQDSSSTALNPFVHRLNIDNHFELAKIYTLSVLLLPIRIVGIVFSLLTAWTFAYITVWGMTRQDLKSKPISGWRRITQRIVSDSMRLVFAFGSIHYVKRVGKQASSKEAPILVVAPHSSYVDSLIIVLTGPSSVVAKKETAYIPILGKIVSCSQPIFVEREDPNSRQNTIAEIISRANSPDPWQQVAIFPEGTCTNRSALIKFKPGAFFPAVPVQPVLLKYPNKLDSYTWTWDGPGFLKLLWLTLARLYSRCEVEFLPVYTPNEEEKTNPKLFADNVRDVMAKAMGVPISEYSFEDCIMMTRAQKMRIPFPGDIVQIENCLHTLGLINSNGNKELATKYCSLPGDDCIDLVTFADILKIDCCNKHLCELFRIFDRNRSGLISLKNYLLCVFYCQIKDEPVIDFLDNIVSLYTSSSRRISRECFKMILCHCGNLTEGKIDALFFGIDYSNKGKISFDEFREYTRDKPEYAFLYKKQELIRRTFNEKL